METVGDILKKHRVLKKITLLEVSKELNISEDILKNIEDNNCNNHIDSVFFIGHVRSYCSFLDLNHNELINQFKKDNFPKKNYKIEIERPKLQYSGILSNKLISLSLILAIFGTFYLLFIEVDNKSREYAIIPDLPENYISIVESANLNENSINNNIKKINEKNIENIEVIPNSSSAIASLPKNQNQKTDIVTLKFLDDTWVQLRDLKNEIIFSQLMNKNDEYTYDLVKGYSITSGNAGHILVIINQKVVGKIGKKGQVVDSLVINKDFNN